MSIGQINVPKSYDPRRFTCAYEKKYLILLNLECGTNPNNELK